MTILAGLSWCTCLLLQAVMLHSGSRPVGDVLGSRLALLLERRGGRGSISVRNGWNASLTDASSGDEPRLMLRLFSRCGHQFLAGSHRHKFGNHCRTRGVQPSFTEAFA